ncbi:hypothetical protein AB0F93_00460 [Micromonospora tulbaghiae]|uniref:hypothetical protein n=1 Tax=Micromonospora tulbaghiae TaxID=479978 RepID=UPI003327A5D3
MNGGSAIDLAAPAADLGTRLIIEATTDPAVRQEVATDPRVVAIVQQAAQLDYDQRMALHKAWSENFRIHRGTQMQLRHRVRRAGGVNHLHFRALDERLHELFPCDHGVQDDCPWSLVCAIQDVIFARLAGRHLTSTEALVFDGPWRKVVNAVELELTDEQFALADRVERHLSRGPQRGLSATQVAAALRVDVAAITPVLNYMVEHRYVHTSGHGDGVAYHHGRA